MKTGGDSHGKVQSMAVSHPWQHEVVLGKGDEAEPCVVHPVSRERKQQEKKKVKTRAAWKKRHESLREQDTSVRMETRWKVQERKQKRCKERIENIFFVLQKKALGINVFLIEGLQWRIRNPWEKGNCWQLLDKLLKRHLRGFLISISLEEKNHRAYSDSNLFT